MSSVGLKQFRVESKSEALLSYCIYDPQSRDAILVDPHLDAVDEYVEFISSQRLKPTLIVETQLHWSHPSAARNLKSRYSCPIASNLSDRQMISLGSFQFQILLTPGVTRDSRVIVGLGVGERLLLSGNTLWIGSCGPGGFPDSDAKLHFQSLKKILESVGDDALVLPAFDSNELIFSTIAIEKKKNIALQRLSSLEEFVKWSQSRAIVPDETFKKIYEANSKDVESDQRFLRLESVFKTSGLAERGEVSIGAISPEKYALKLKEHSSSYAFLDVREPDEYSAGHMPGTENFPWIEVGFHLTPLKEKKRIYVSCLSGRRSTWVSRTLAYLGFNDVVNVEGGFSRWQSAGLPIEKGAKK
jgi:rhodanese-related sulfurtransferase/glyoxylase-like metal-dependent hydrolase (beta-lactamase superfamily II)